jgi:hypothetical protein
MTRAIIPPRRPAALLGAIAAIVLLGACSSDNIRDVSRTEYNSDSRRDRVVGRLTGQDDGIVLFGTARTPRPGEGDGGGAGLGVNAYLWRATLDTLAFMPLASADPFGGVIITDWYSPPGAAGERFKATAYVMGRQLRSDGVRVSVFRQVRGGNAWVDAPVAASTGAELEDRVLARARELRSQTAGR